MAARKDACVTERTSWPSTKMAPLETSKKRNSRRTSVDLPLPVAPTKATVLPGPMANET